jgi:hypothetical protein
MPSTFWEYIARSTCKREIATAFLIWWAGVGTYLMCRVPITQLVPDAALTTWAGLGVIVVGFAVGAFGTDWISKQTTIAGPPMGQEIKTETTVSEGSATTSTTSTPVDLPPAQEVKP